MRRPSHFFMGPFRWDIKWRHPDNGDFYGTTEETRLLVQVRQDMDEQYSRETLFHELLHAGFSTACLRREDEEQIVSALSPFLLDALRRTPGLADYLLAK